MDNFLHKELSNVDESTHCIRKQGIPDDITNNLNDKFTIRKYQEEAFKRFLFYTEDYKRNKPLPVHLMFQMATGSGKTLLMAGLILYLYSKGYRNFLFFVNSTNIIEKTKDNFLNPQSSKYLFSRKGIFFSGRRVEINEVSHFDEGNDADINIHFTTIQGLYSALKNPSEGGFCREGFEEKKVVFLADEAHHLNVGTRGKNDGQNWENTVLDIFERNEKNFLLEFTATIDVGTESVRKKYLDKLIFHYDLLQFRNDFFSKDIQTLSLDGEFSAIMLQAVLLSQYRLKIAEQNGIVLKPAILFKANGSIARSEKNEKTFNQLINDLTVKDIEKIQAINQAGNHVMSQAFKHFEKAYGDNFSGLVEEIKSDFSSDVILNVNNEKETEANQLLLNSLEDKDNPIRVIFAVNKLNEGWDVLNLFDIVRLYNRRDGKWKGDTYKPGKITISEVQLIGRGARYYPFGGTMTKSFTRASTITIKIASLGY